MLRLRGWHCHSPAFNALHFWQGGANGCAEGSQGYFRVGFQGDCAGDGYRKRVARRVDANGFAGRLAGGTDNGMVAAFALVALHWGSLFNFCSTGWLRNLVVGGTTTQGRWMRTVRLPGTECKGGNKRLGIPNLGRIPGKAKTVQDKPLTCAAPLRRRVSFRLPPSASQCTF